MPVIERVIIDKKNKVLDLIKYFSLNANIIVNPVMENTFAAKAGSGKEKLMLLE